jgi:hypothetical protein
MHPTLKRIVTEPVIEVGALVRHRDGLGRISVVEHISPEGICTLFTLGGRFGFHIEELELLLPAHPKGDEEE